MKNCFYINLERKRSRRKFMEHQIRILGLSENFARWPGVDAAEISAEAMPNYLPGEKRPRTDGHLRWRLSKAEVAIFESHRRIWQQVVDARLPHAIILEDDVKLSSTVPGIIEKLGRHASGVDVVKMDWIRRFRRFGPPAADFDVEIRPIVEQRLNSAAAYLVSNRGARKLLDWSSPYSDLVDAFIFQTRDSYGLYQLFPAVAVQGVILGSQAGLEGPPAPTDSIAAQIMAGKPKPKAPLWFTMAREGRLGADRIRRFFGGDRKLAKEGGWIGFVPLAGDLDHRN